MSEFKGMQTIDGEVGHYDRDSGDWVRSDERTIVCLKTRVAELESDKERIKDIAEKAVRAGEKRVAELEGSLSGANLRAEKLDTSRKVAGSRISRLTERLAELKKLAVNL